MLSALCLSFGPVIVVKREPQKKGHFSVTVKAQFGHNVEMHNLWLHTSNERQPIFIRRVYPSWTSTGTSSSLVVLFDGRDMRLDNCATTTTQLYVSLST